MRSLLIVLLAAVLVPARTGLAAPLADGPTQHTISVSGEAVVRTAPDQVIINVAAESAGTDLSRILADTDAATTRVRSLARDFHILPEHIQTDSITLQPRYIDSKPAGYTARRSIVLCSKDLGRVNDLLSALVKAGVNRIESIAFETSQLRKFRDDARVQAVRAARQKAQLLATELGAKVGRPLTVTEGASPIQTAGGGSYQNFVREESGAAAADGGFAPGQIAVNAHVHVVFQLE